MSTFPHTVVEFTQPAFVGGTVPHLIVNGAPITQQGLEIDWSREKELPVMTTLSGLSIVHHLPESALQPTTVHGWEFSGTVGQPSENTRNALDFAEAMTAAGLLSLWCDAPSQEIWLSDGATATLTTSRAFGWATAAPHGVTSANRPARAWYGSVAAANEQTVVYSGTPSAGEVLIPDTTDGTSITLGTVPAAGTAIIVSAHWLRGGVFTVEHSRSSLATYEISFDFSELVPERAFS